jgi:hypothetical protein
VQLLIVVVQGVYWLSQQAVHGQASGEPEPETHAAMEICDQNESFGSVNALIRHLSDPV